MKGTRSEASIAVKYVPRHGPLSPSHGWVASGPLSLVKITIVFSSMPASLIASRICPVRWSISARQSAQSPLPVLPANSGFGSVGKCTNENGNVRIERLVRVRVALDEIHSMARDLGFHCSAAVNVQLRNLAG